MSILYRGAKLMVGEDQVFTEVELKTLEKVINETTVCTDKCRR